MIKRLNILLGIIILVLITLIITWYVNKGKTTFILYRASQNMNRASSFEAVTTINLEGEVELLGNKDLNSTLIISSKVVKKPHLRVMQEYQAELYGLNATVAKHYIEKQDNEYVIYSNNSLLSNGWSKKKTLGKKDGGDISSLELLGFITLVDREVVIKRVSDDVIDGKEVIEIELILQDEDTKTLVRTILSTISEEPIPDELNDTVDRILNQESLAVYIYIDKRTEYFYRVEFDLTRIMSLLLEDEDVKLNTKGFNFMKSLSSELFNLNELSVEIMFKKYNKTDFTVPNVE